MKLRGSFPCGSAFTPPLFDYLQDVQAQQAANDREARYDKKDDPITGNSGNLIQNTAVDSVHKRGGQANTPRAAATMTKQVLRYSRRRPPPFFIR